jgi:hypothetical protein
MASTIRTDLGYNSRNHMGMLPTRNPCSALPDIPILEPFDAESVTSTGTPQVAGQPRQPCLRVALHHLVVVDLFATALTLSDLRWRRAWQGALSMHYLAVLCQWRQRPKVMTIRTWLGLLLGYEDGKDGAGPRLTTPCPARTTITLRCLARRDVVAASPPNATKT